MDSRQTYDQSELTLVALPKEVIGHIFSFLDFQELAIVVLVNQDFLQQASCLFLKINTAWQASMKQQFPLYHDFLVSTRADKFIDWQMEYDSTKHEITSKSSRPLTFAKPNLSKENIKAMEGQAEDKHLISVAIRNGYVDLVQYFYEKNQYTSETQVDDIPILMLASLFGHLSVCQYFWALECLNLKKPQHERGCTNPKSGSTAGRALLLLFVKGHIQLIKYCIHQDVERNMNYCAQLINDDEEDDAEWVVSDDEDSALPENAGKALVSGSQGSVSPAEPSAVNRSVYQTLVWCIQYNYLEILKRLLRKYPDPIYKNYALYAAAKGDNLEFVKYLLSRGASPNFIMPRDLIAGFLPHQVTPFEIAGFCNARTVERYLFLKLTLNDLKLDLNQIDEENNPKVLLNAMRYVLKTFDSNWSSHLTRKASVCFQKKDAEGNVSAGKKEKFYHEKSRFSAWLQVLWKKLVQRIFVIYLSKIHNNEGIDQGGKNNFLGFFSTKYQTLKEACAMTMGPIVPVLYPTIKLNGLPEDVIELMAMNEAFLEKSGIDSDEMRYNLFYGSDDEESFENSCSVDPNASDSDNSDADQSDAEDHDDEDAHSEQYASPKPGRP